jgi:hypothetical protein
LGAFPQDVVIGCLKRTNPQEKVFIQRPFLVVSCVWRKPRPELTCGRASTERMHILYVSLAYYHQTDHWSVPDRPKLSKLKYREIPEVEFKDPILCIEPCLRFSGFQRRLLFPQLDGLKIMIRTIKQYLLLHLHSTDELLPNIYTKIHVSNIVVTL